MAEAKDQAEPGILRSGLLHLLVLSASMAIALGRILWLPPPFTWRHGLALLLLAGCWYGRASRRAWWRPLLLATLIAATFYLVLFDAGVWTFVFSFSINDQPITLGIQPLFMLLAIHAGWMWKNDVRGWVAHPASPSELHEAHRSRIDLFVRNMKNKSTAELQALLSDPKALVPDARIAAEEVLASRQGAPE